MPTYDVEVSIRFSYEIQEENEDQAYQLAESLASEEMGYYDFVQTADFTHVKCEPIKENENNG